MIATRNAMKCAENAMERALARSNAHEAAGRFSEAASAELAAYAHFNVAHRLKEELCEASKAG